MAGGGDGEDASAAEAAEAAEAELLDAADDGVADGGTEAGGAEAARQRQVVRARAWVRARRCEMSQHALSARARDLESAMLRPTSQPIGTPLTTLHGAAGGGGGDDDEAAEMEGAAVRMFDRVLGAMGLRRYPFPQLLGAELVAGLAERRASSGSGALADELFVQLMKQLGGAAGTAGCGAAANRGWALLELALRSLPPSEQLEHFLEAFLRRRQRADLVLQVSRSRSRTRCPPPTPLLPPSCPRLTRTPGHLPSFLPFVAATTDAHHAGAREVGESSASAAAAAAAATAATAAAIRVT